MIVGFAFDLEGTLVDLEAAHHEGHLLAARELGLSLSLDQAMREIPSFVGGPDRAIARELVGLSGTSLSVDEVERRTLAHYREIRSAMPIRPRAGAVAFLRRVRELGIPLAIGSVTPRADGEMLLERSGLDRVFPEGARVFLEDVARPKPAPEVYLRTARVLGVEPDEQIVFEDSPTGVRAALAAGSLVVATPAPGARHLVETLREAGAAKVARAWSELPEPLQLVDSLLGASSPRLAVR